MRNRVLTLLLPLLSLVLLAGLAAAASGPVGRPMPSENTSLAQSSITYTSGLTSFLPLIIRDYEVPVDFFDDFSDPDSGWPIAVQDEVSWGYRDGEYEIWLKDADTWAVALWPYDGGLSSYTVELDARQPAGHKSTYGILFDFKDWQNYLIYFVDPNTPESFAIFQLENDVWKPIIDRTTSGWINPGSAVNRLKLVRDGLQLTVYVNGHQLFGMTDLGQQGNWPVGLLSAAAADGDTSLFDNFKYVSGNQADGVPSSGKPSVPHGSSPAVPDWLLVPPERPGGD